MEVKFQIAHYGEKREVNATPGELAIFGAFAKLLPEDLAARLEMVRVSDGYVTARIGDWDIARMKSTERTQWISLPIAEVGPPKHKLTDPDTDLPELTDLIDKSIETFRRFDK